VIAETFLQLLGDWPHWAFEVTVEAVTGLVFAPIIRRALRRHDRRHH
jgi:hypothetical protein